MTYVYHVNVNHLVSWLVEDTTASVIQFDADIL